MHQVDYPPTLTNEHTILGATYGSLVHTETSGHLRATCGSLVHRGTSGHLSCKGEMITDKRQSQCVANGLTIVTTSIYTVNSAEKD